MLGMVALQIVLPLFIYIAVLIVKQNQKAEIAGNKDSSANFEKIKISNDQATADYKPGDEFMYNGVLYDIDEVTKENGDYIIIALADKKETGLQELNAGTQEQTRGYNSHQVKIMPFYFLFYEACSNWIPGERIEASSPAEYHQTNFSEPAFQIITPPPRIV